MVCTGTSVVQLHALRWRILFQYLALGVQCFIFEDSSYLGNLTWYFSEIYSVSSLSALCGLLKKLDLQIGQFSRYARSKVDLVFASFVGICLDS